jgi:hypothetical protein
MTICRKLKNKQEEYIANMTMNNTTLLTINDDCPNIVAKSRVMRSRKAPPSASTVLKQQQKEIRQNMLDQAVKLYINAMQSGSTNVPPNTFRTIISTFGNPSWMTKNAIYYHYQKNVKKVNDNNNVGIDNNEAINHVSADNNQPNVILNSTNNVPNEVSVEPTAEAADLSDLTSSSRRKTGRPRGMLARKQEDKKLESAKVIAAQEYQEKKKEKKKLENGTLDKIIIESLAKVGLPSEYQSMISKKTIESRVNRKNALGYAGSYSQSSPMAEMEPLLVGFCLHLNRMAKSINEKEFLALANDIIDGTPTAEKVKRFQHEICGTGKEGTLLGRKYFVNFMKRHKEILHTKRIHNRCVNRLEWATYDNIEKMYSLVYKEMVAAGVARELESPVYFDKENNIVGKDDNVFGTLSNTQVLDPSYLIFVDETGSSTNMRKDKVGSKNVIAEKGFSGARQAISTDLRYTTMGFTAGTGEPVMCCIIFTSDSKRGIPSNWVTGIDITKIDATFSLPEDNNDAMEKLGEIGSVAGGGPRCVFRNKNVPCLIQ